jgi:glycosyltransferase involved in cell wall biosynthesis
LNPLRGRVLVIVPAHDEEESLPRTVQEVRLKANPVDLLVVDDGSTDRTAEVARALGVPVVSLPVNLGVGGALQTGFRYALARGYQVGVQLDADGQHDPAYLEPLLAPVLAGQADVSIGSRYVTGNSSYRAPAARRLGMIFFSWVVRVAVGRSIADTTSGFRAYGREVMRACLRDFPKDFPDAPLLIRLARQGFRMVEVPVEMRQREAGKSFYTLTKSLYYPYKCLLASVMAVLTRRS